MNWFEKVRDNFIPMNSLLNKFFYTEKVASLLLKCPMSDIGQETSLIFLVQKGFTKYQLLKLYKKQMRLIMKIEKAMARFRVYDTTTKKYVQTIHIRYGQGIEYLILGEILERDFGFSFKYTPKEIAEDKGQALCSDIEQVMNRIGDYFQDKNRKTLKSIQNMVKEQQIQRKIANAEE